MTIAAKKPIAVKMAARQADEGTFLNEDRYEEPKAVFKVFREILSRKALPPGARILDAGCATGELIYYLRKELPQVKRFEGIDVSEKMITRARKFVPGASFEVASVLDGGFFRRRRYDAVICSSVLSLFDSADKAVSNLLACVKEGGIVIVSGAFNADPVDVVMRYRRSGSPGDVWESGWNIFSCRTIERLLAKSPVGLRWRWQDFRMPFPIPKRDNDPMRTWTVATSSDPNQLVNGACQLITIKILIIDVEGAASGRNGRRFKRGRADGLR
jgi:SAM-dependent methyltransferase